MEFTILKSGSFRTSPWSGGTTTELFIFPPTANYTERNFQFRLSTAKVEAATSDFTILNGIARKLMVLEGDITVLHEAHYSKQLTKFDVDAFDGGWKTMCIGTCTDFNLMTAPGISGEISGSVLDRESQFLYHLNENDEWFFIYVFAGMVAIDHPNLNALLHQGDLLIINANLPQSIEIKALERSELVFSSIFKTEQSM